MVQKSDEGTTVPSPRGKRITRSIACAAACCLALLVSPIANADPGDPVIPSKQSVEDAQQQAVAAQGSVDSIEAQLTQAKIAIENLGVAAGKAAVGFEGAQFRWGLAKQAAATAKAWAARALAAAEESRSSLAGYVVTHDTAGSQLTALSTAMTASGTHSLINQLSDYNTASSALDAKLQQWLAASRLARVYQAQAVSALAEAAQAKTAAEAAKQAAADAVAQQQAAVGSITAQKSALISQLAAAQNTSVQLAADRAAGLERQRQERLAEARRLAALEQARQEAREQARQQALEEQRPAEARAAPRREQRQQERQQQSQPPAQQPPAQQPPPQQPPPQQPPPQQPPPQQPPPQQPPAGGAATAIAFAYAQLGEPYVWGAAGPDAWDCSGLTMGAWAAAGVYLPHYSVAQYAALQHITMSELQPGDLVFWRSSSDPNSIYHVALYIGNNQIIQAPHTGAYVEVSGLYDWTLPNFFGRV